MEHEEIKVYYKIRMPLRAGCLLASKLSYHDAGIALARVVEDVQFASLAEAIESAEAIAEHESAAGFPAPVKWVRFDGAFRAGWGMSRLVLRQTAAGELEITVGEELTHQVTNPERVGEAARERLLMAGIEL